MRSLPILSTEEVQILLVVHSRSIEGTLPETPARKRLQQAGLLESCRDRAIGRQSVWRLTDAGRAKVGELRKRDDG